MERLRKAGNANAFIREPQPTKEMYDAVQDMHPKTLSACFIIAIYTSKRNVDIIYRDMMEQVMESGHSWAPLHLKVIAYHHDLVAEGEALPLEWLNRIFPLESENFLQMSKTFRKPARAWNAPFGIQPRRL